VEGVWSGAARLVDPEPEAGTRFGAAVAISGDVLVVGAPDDPRCASSEGLGRCSQAGAAHVFVRTSTTWRHAATLRKAQGAALDLFGFVVDVAARGDRVAVGVKNDARCGAGIDPAPGAPSCSTTGAVEVFVRRDDAWRREAVLKSATPSIRGFFGQAVAFDHGFLVVGEPGEAACSLEAPEDDGCPDSGAVHVYRRDDRGWHRVRVEKSSRVRPGHRFGAPVAAADALAVGVPGDGGCAPDDDGTACFESGAVELIASWR